MSSVKSKIYEKLAELRAIADELSGDEELSLGDFLGVCWDLMDNPCKNNMEKLILASSMERKDFTQFILVLFLELVKDKDIEIHELEHPGDGTEDVVSLQKFNTGYGYFDGYYFKTFPKNSKKVLGFKKWSLSSESN